MAVIKLVPEMSVLYEMKMGLIFTLVVIILSLMYTYYKSHQVLSALYILRQSLELILLCSTVVTHSKNHNLVSHIVIAFSLFDG